VDRFYAIGRVQPTVLHIDGKVGAQQGTQSAVHAVGAVGEFRGVVALGVGVPGHDEHVLRAELNAKTASFASLLNDMNDAVGHLNAVPIKRLSPIAHNPTSIPL
jgi:hypothetical protein